MRCYYCESPPTSQEHAPPRCLFPTLAESGGVDLRKNLITVPSCEEHNSLKAGDDEHLMYVLSMNVTSGSEGQRLFESKVIRAIQRRAALAHRVLKETAPVVLRDERTGEEFQTIAVRADWPRLEETFKRIASALFAHHFGSVYRGPIRVIMEFQRSIKGASAANSNAVMLEISAMADRLFKASPLRGENQPIFAYQVVGDASSDRVAMRSHFYGGSKVFVAFGDDA